MSKPLDAALVWFRRDLRAHVWCVYVFDTTLLDPLPRADRRVEFIRESLVELDAALRALAESHGVHGAGLIVRHGEAVQELAALAQALHVQAVYANHDPEPAARERDARARGVLADAGIALHLSKDQVIFDADEVVSGAGTPYGVFTPYRNAWLRQLAPWYVQAYPVARHAAALAPRPPADARPVPELAALGFEATNLRELKIPTGMSGAQALLEDFLARIDRYAEARNYPAVKGPSYLSVHLRFGTVSVRHLVREAWDRMRAGSRGAEVWLSELVWREFYQQILHHHPEVVTHSFRPEYDAIRWEHGKAAQSRFEAWCQGRTGYPLVDAAMQQLLHTGYMHNRLRMVTASFLVKDLGIDWRRGEHWFALHLNDYDLASNNGGWQWVASTGCDAQPYFRIFNPVTQSRRYDPEGRFIRRYLPQLARLDDTAIHAPWQAGPAALEAAGVVLGRDYPPPLVDHDEARRKTLARYAAVTPRLAQAGPRRRR
jgi:deoxyribodipyrimidine photo-lyase